MLPAALPAHNVEKKCPGGNVSSHPAAEARLKEIVLSDKRSRENSKPPSQQNVANRRISAPGEKPVAYNAAVLAPETSWKLEARAMCENNLKCLRDQAAAMWQSRQNIDPK